MENKPYAEDGPIACLLSLFLSCQPSIRRGSFLQVQQPDSAKKLGVLRDDPVPIVKMMIGAYGQARIKRRVKGPRQELLLVGSRQLARADLEGCTVVKSLTFTNRRL
jgi:hypothetical protein